MRIGIDARGIYKELDGIGRFGINLLRELAHLDSFNEYIVYKNPEMNSSIVSKPNFTERIINIPRFTIKEQVVLPEIFKKDKLDIFHCLHNVLPVFYYGKSIVTIYDIMTIAFPWFYEAFPLIKRYIGFFYFKLSVGLSAKKASKVIVTSKYTKKEVMRYLNLEREKVKICSAAVDKVFKPINDNNLLNNVLEKYKISESFILYTGNFKPYKNLKRIIKAYDLLLKRRRPLPKLVIGGYDKKYEKPIKEFVMKNGLEEEIVFTGYIERNDLPLLMNQALFFVFPSIYEGFGLPPLEAMACGTPVITSNTSSLPEVVGDAAVLVNPYNIKEIADAIENVLTNKKLREKLISKGLERVKLFSWEKCAKETLKVYEEVYNEK
ncbi:glycosyltransferase family 4 protein [candidate division WOR-3 bacterium]|nr:glycosyltransferase family 4 protein [candidate division WOR-3 bacterium]